MSEPGVSMYFSRIVFAVGLMVTAPPSWAATLLVNGTVTNISALNNGQPAATPSGTISIGDKFSLNASFDLSNAQLTQLYDADPAINIYYLPNTTVSLKIGNYSTQFQPSFNFNSSLQIWDNFQVATPVDSQSFSFFRYQAPPNEVPFQMGSEAISYSIDQYNFDNTASARHNDLITDLAPLSSFGTHMFSVGFLNPTTNLFVYVGGTVENGIFSGSAVPEPSTWALMIFGFGAVGGALRNRKLNDIPAYAGRIMVRG